ncbi:DUF6207 family protein [Streptomyces sp. enrichment culture]|uniref:DUF6207 family protein n=1 Tax=Streptomyces sp. enrichment culture TaxID=1795815 RepID=UPI003F57E010
MVQRIRTSRSGTRPTTASAEGQPATSFAACTRPRAAPPRPCGSVIRRSSPGLAVVNVAAADDETAIAFHAALAERWATTSVERTIRDAGQPGYGCAVPRHADGDP